MGSPGSEANESSPGAGGREGSPADPAHLAHGPTLLLQQRLKAENPYDLHVLVYYC